MNYVWVFLHPMGDFTQLPHPPPPHKVKTAVDKAYSSISNDMEKHTTNLNQLCRIDARRCARGKK